VLWMTLFSFDVALVLAARYNLCSHRDLYPAEF
jgi:hypothetical protein